MDKQFQDRRRMSRSRNRPKHALYGVTSGANSLVSSVASGIGGLARKPLEGAERDGALGFFKGVGKGVIGLATKPAIGVFDLASSKFFPLRAHRCELTIGRRHRGYPEYNNCL
jgi:vacuolar protein sorting-associated protein 13A/C